MSSLALGKLFDDFAFGNGVQTHLDHFIAPTFHAHIHNKVDDEMIVTVAGKGSFDIYVVNCSGVFPPIVLFRTA